MEGDAYAREEAARGYTLATNSRMKRKLRMATLTIALAIFRASISAIPGYAQDMDNARKGQGLYEKYCSVCHGAGGTGQDNDKPAGGWDNNNNLIAPALNGTGHAWHHSPSLIYQYIQKGSIDESSPMPSFGDRLDDNDIRSIISYIQSLWPDRILNTYKERFRDKMQ